MSYMTNGLLIYGEIFAHFLISCIRILFLIYMTLHPIPSEFPYIWGEICFLFYRCTRDDLSVFYLQFSLLPILTWLWTGEAVKLNMLSSSPSLSAIARLDMSIKGIGSRDRITIFFIKFDILCLTIRAFTNIIFLLDKSLLKGRKEMKKILGDLENV